MKVGLLVQRFPHGGAEKYVEELAQRLRQQQEDAVVITSNNKNSDDSKYDFKIIRLGSYFSIGEYSFWKGLEETLNREKFDVIHTNTYGYYHSDKAARLKKKFGYKLVMTSHGFHGTELHRLKKNKVIRKSSHIDFLREFYDKKIGFKTLQFADHLIALSKKDVEFYKEAQISESKISIIPPGVRSSFFKTEFDENLRKRLDGDPILISVGELSWIKSTVVQIKAMPEVLKQRPKTKLFLIGKDRTELANLKEFCVRHGLEKNVFFLGYKSDEELHSYLHSSDLLLHTSLAEGLSTILLEAMACGLPFITTPAGGNGYLAEETSAGAVIPFENERMLAKTIVSLIDDKGRLQTMSENGKKYATKLDWDKVFDRIYQAYQKVLSA